MKIQSMQQARGRSEPPDWQETFEDWRADIQPDGHSSGAPDSLSQHIIIIISLRWIANCARRVGGRSRREALENQPLRKHCSTMRVVVQALSASSGDLDRADYDKIPSQAFLHRTKGIVPSISRAMKASKIFL